MTNTIQVAKRLVPVEQVALIEPYIPVEGAPLRSAKEFKGRIVLLNRDSILTEEEPGHLAKAHGFRMIVLDQVATNPTVSYAVEIFEPGDSFTPVRPFRTRLLWRGPDRMTHSRLLVASPETVLAVAVRGERDPEAPAEAPEDEASRPRRAGRTRAAATAKDPA